MNQIHPFTAYGQTGRWLQTLERMRADLAAVPTIYPGHGPAGGVAMVDFTRAYLLTYRANVAALAQGQPVLTDAAKQELQRRMIAYWPDNKLRLVILFNADAVAAELAVGQA